MAIGPIEVSGAVVRTQDYSVQKHVEDNRGILEQANIQVQIKKEVMEKSTQVKRADDSDFYEERYDAKEKGKGTYGGDGGKNRSKKEEDGKVLLKSTSSFDIKI